MIECWKDIDGFNGYYQVSSQGRIRSLNRIVHRRNGRSYQVKEKILKLGLDTSTGYYNACLLKNGEQLTESIHVLVARHFVPNPKGLPEVNHKDLDKTNNRYTNLEWCSRLGNVRHAVGLGRYAKICPAQRKLIFDLKSKGLSNTDIAEKANVSRQTVWNLTRLQIKQETEVRIKPTIQVKPSGNFFKPTHRMKPISSFF